MRTIPYDQATTDTGDLLQIMAQKLPDVAPGNLYADGRRTGLWRFATIAGQAVVEIEDVAGVTLTAEDLAACATIAAKGRAALTAADLVTCSDAMVSGLKTSGPQLALHGIEKILRKGNNQPAGDYDEWVDDLWNLYYQNKEARAAGNTAPNDIRQWLMANPCPATFSEIRKGSYDSTSSQSHTSSSDSSVSSSSLSSETPSSSSSGSESSYTWSPGSSQSSESEVSSSQSSDSTDSLSSQSETSSQSLSSETPSSSSSGSESSYTWSSGSSDSSGGGA